MLSLPFTRHLATQLGWRMAVLLLALLLVLSVLAYGGARSLALQRLSLQMEQQVALRALQLGQPLQEGERSVQRLHKAWQERAQAYPRGALTPAFDALFAPGADGVWRLRPERVDAERLPTFYLQAQPTAHPDSLRLRALVSYELLSERGPALVPPYFSAYVDFVERGLMVYSQGIDWGRTATPQTNNHDYPTMQGADPRRNPQRQLFWTPVYFDAEARTWMVSVIQPLDFEGAWAGTVGHDLSLQALLDSVGKAKTPDFTAMIFNQAGELIAHPALAAQIAKADGQLALTLVNDSALSAAWALMRAQPEGGPRVGLTADGRHLVAWAEMPGPLWWAVEVAPIERLDALMRPLMLPILLVGLLGLGLGLLGLRQVIRRKVHRPLEQLGQAIEHLRDGQRPEAVGLQGDNELSRIGLAFDRMAHELATRRELEQQQALALQHEVQERQQAEAALRLLNESLERRIGDRTQELSLANQGLTESLDQLRVTQEHLVQKETLAGLGSLVAGVAHELNTPMGNALLAASTLEASSKDLLAALGAGGLRRSEVERLLQGQAQAAELIVGNLQRGVDLVGSFKQVAVDQAGLQRRRFGLREVTAEVIGLLLIGVRRSAYAVEIEVPAELDLEGYPGAYGQVITNLLQNALVHGFEGRSQGRVLIRLVSQTPNELVLEVADDGNGIAAEHIGQVFKPFFTTRLGQGGSGLGLHIVYTLVTGLLGGRVEVNSAPGNGCSVKLTLPRVAPVSD